MRPCSCYLVQVVWGLCRAGGLGQGRNTYDLGQAIQGGIDAFVTSIEISHGRAGAHTMAVAHLPRDSSHAVFPHLLCGGKAREQGSPAAARGWRPQWRCQVSTRQTHMEFVRSHAMMHHNARHCSVCESSHRIGQIGGLIETHQPACTVIVVWGRIWKRLQDLPTAA